MHTLVCVPILNIVLSFLTSFYRLSATMSVPSRLCFRVETPTSAARFSRRFGIVSKAYRDAYENNRSTRRRDIPAQIDPPLAAKSQSKIIKHLRGDRFPSPFISATRDIYRALSIASSRLFHAWHPDNIMLCVIDEDRLREEPLYVPDYFRDMSNIYNSVLIHDICYIVNTAKLNDEIIIRRYVPRRAILRRIPISSFLVHLPVWLKEPHTDMLLSWFPPEQKKKIRTWYMIIKHLRQLNDPERRNPPTECWDLAEAIMGPDSGDNIYTICALLALGPFDYP